MVKLIIIPAAAGHRRCSEQGSRRNLLPPPNPRPSQCSTLNGLRNRINSGSRSKGHRILQRVGSCNSSSRMETASVGSASTQSSWGPPSASCGVMLSHPELVSVTLQIDCRGSYELTLEQAQDYESPIVLNVEANSLLQNGRRLSRVRNADGFFSSSSVGLWR